MSIRVACEHCQRSFNASKKYAGKNVKCPGCGQPIAIPHDDGFDKIVEHLDAPNEPQNEPEPQRPAEPPELHPEPQQTATPELPREPEAERKTVAGLLRSNSQTLIVVAVLLAFLLFIRGPTPEEAYLTAIIIYEKEAARLAVAQLEYDAARDRARAHVCYDVTGQLVGFAKAAEVAAGLYAKNDSPERADENYKQAQDIYNTISEFNTKAKDPKTEEYRKVEEAYKKLRSRVALEDQRERVTRAETTLSAADAKFND